MTNSIFVVSLGDDVELHGNRQREHHRRVHVIRTDQGTLKPGLTAKCYAESAVTGTIVTLIRFGAGDSLRERGIGG